VLFALAWGSSSLAAALPPLLLAADWVANGRNLRQRASIHAGAWALLASFALVRTASGAIPSSVPASLGAQAAALVENAGILLTGRGLSAVHPQPASGGVAELALVTLAGLAALVLLARRSVAGFALAWGLIVLSASTWTPSGQPLLSDVRLYPAAVAAGLLLTAAYAALAPYPAARYAAAAAVTILIVAAGVGAFSRNTLWNQPARLWLDAVAQTPRSALANLRAGEAQLLEAERLLAELAATGDGLDTQTISVRRQRVAELAAEARPYLETAAALDEESAEARYLLGVSLALQNARDEALAAFKDALARSLGDYGATLEIARLYQARASESGSLEDTRRALDYFQRAARLAPGRPDHVAGLGLALASLGDWLGAHAALAPIVPESADEVSASPLAQRYAEIRAMAAQVETLQEQARQRLGGERVPTDVLRIQAQRRFLERNYLPAAYLLDRYLAEVPGDAVGWALLGAARARIGSADRFLAEYPPPTVAAGQPSPWLQLATFCAMDGAWGDARNYLTSPVARQTLPMPLMALAETALGLQQLDRATALLREATETHPDAPDPWLRLADIAIATNEQAAARGYLDQAAARGAADTALDPRRERLGDPDEAPEVPRVLLR
jgi:tetratricopeptide (TPR) repeat protein